jgi:inosine/xanthosine triphosphatase
MHFRQIILLINVAVCNDFTEQIENNFKSVANFKKMKRIVVASKNPVKLKAVQKGFEMMFPQEEFLYKTVDVKSNVPDQPKGNDETFNGAYNRVINAKKELQDYDFYVGLEGGIEDNEEMSAFAWIVVMSNKKVGKAKTGTFYLPIKIAELVREGIELGKADDIVFNQVNSKQKQGTVGILTENVIDRESYYSHAVALALIPFKNEDLY